MTHLPAVCSALCQCLGDNEECENKGLAPPAKLTWDTKKGNYTVNAMQQDRHQELPLAGPPSAPPAARWGLQH